MNDIKPYFKSREEFLIEMGRAFEFFNYSLTEIFERFMDIARKIASFDAAFGLIVDEMTSESYIPYIENLNIDLERLDITSRADINTLWQEMPPGFMFNNIPSDKLPEVFSSYPSLKSFIMIPLITGNQLLGVIAFGSETPDNFKESQMDYLFSLSDQLAIAARHIIMHKDARDQIQRLNYLLKLEMGMDATNGVDSFISQLVSIIKQEYELIGLSFFLKNEETMEFYPHYTEGLHCKLPRPDAFKLNELSDELQNSIVNKRQPYVLNEKPPSLVLQIFKMPEVTRSILILPLVQNDLLYGILSLASKDKKYFSPFRIRYISLLTSYAGISLRNSILYGKLKSMLVDVKKSRDESESYANQLKQAHISLEKRYQELSNLHEIGKTLNGPIVLKDVLDLILTKSVALVNAGKASIMLHDPDKKKLKIHSSIGIDKETVEGLELSVGEGVAGKVFQTGSSRLLQSILDEPDFISSRNQSKADETLIVVPLKIAGKPIGVLSVDNLNSHGSFSLEDLERIESLADQASIAIHKARLFEDIHDLYEDTLRVLTAAIDAKDPYTHGHSDRVALISVEIAKKMNLSKDEVDDIYQAALLHDFGKVFTDKGILTKTSRLTPEETKLMQEHPVTGANVIRQIKRLEKVSTYIRHHHEYYDGAGYPDGLKEEDIPLGSRIILVADTFDAMTTDRSYRKALSFDVTLQELRRLAGKQFDPLVVGALLSLPENRQKYIRGLTRKKTAVI